MNTNTNQHEITTFLSTVLPLTTEQTEQLEEMIRRAYLRVQRESADATDERFEALSDDLDLDGRAETAIEEAVEHAVDNLDFSDQVERAIEDADFETLANEAVASAIDDADIDRLVERAMDDYDYDDKFEDAFRAQANKDTERLETLAANIATETLTGLTLGQRLRWLFTGKLA